MPFDMRTTILLISLWTLRVKSWSLSNLLMSGSQADLSLAESVAIGAHIGIQECKEQFKWDRWNCPRSSLPVFSRRSSQPATKEVAFVYAITSAGVMHTLTRNCSLGNFEKCNCDSKKSSFSSRGWKWSGCSDNIHFGDKIARQYLDGREIGRDGRAIVNLQNNRAGRLAVKKTMQRLCKCHGVSGSCATKTCWMKLSDFSTVGRHLKKLYARAVKIEFSGYNGRSTEDTALPLAISKINKKHLVYIEPSPNYCRANRTIGVQGTLGRECSRNRGKDVARSQRRSCKSLCKDCGLGIMKKVMTVTKNCNCKFQWCCEVKCDRCVHQTVRYNCRK